MLRRLYDWCIGAADKTYATWIMGAVSFLESSIFPVPPDAMLIPMGLARPERAYYFATICTITSVAGGIAGYLIGWLLYDSLGQWLMTLYGYGNKVEAFRESYARWGSLIILLKGVTPIPYKIITITSGFAGYSFVLFVLFSFVARGMRFYSSHSCSGATANERVRSSKSGSASGSPSAWRFWSSASSRLCTCSECIRVCADDHAHASPILLRLADRCCRVCHHGHRCQRAHRILAAVSADRR